MCHLLLLEFLFYYRHRNTVSVNFESTCILVKIMLTLALNKTRVLFSLQIFGWFWNCSVRVHLVLEGSDRFFAENTAVLKMKGRYGSFSALCS
jgi:hypothetical protein